MVFLSACAPGTTVASEPSPVVAFASLPTDSLQAVSVPPTPTVPPMRFVLPTPGAEPVSGWRPPLYDIPWAIGPYDHFYFARPIPANEVNWPLADYRYGGIFFGNTVHTGVDIDATEGAPVLAAGNGTVVWAGWGLFTESPTNKNDPYGQAVAIEHDFGYRDQKLYTIYAHMQRVDVVVGQYVNTGEPLGLVGNTGHTTGPHLHFEVRLGDNSFFQTLNPELWMVPPQGWGVLVGRLTDTKGENPLHYYPVDVYSETTRRLYSMRTYGGGVTNPDPYFNENFVLSDLPAGLYKITLNFEGKNVQFWVNIYAGQITYFTFQGANGFTLSTPPTPSLDFLPVTATPAPTTTP